MSTSMLLKVFFSSLMLLFFININSQTEKQRNNPWVVGVGVSAIDDSGTQLSRPFSFNKNYHFSSPFKFSLEKRFANDFGVEGSVNFNSFKKGKLFNLTILDESIRFFATDASLKYYITNIFLDKYRSYFEGFLLLGTGMSFYNGVGGLNFNVGGGITIYVSNRIRLIGQAMGKLDVSKIDGGSNYFQYDVGLIYRLPRKKTAK